MLTQPDRQATTIWREIPQGSAEDERLLFERLAQDMMHVQLKTRRRSKTAGIRRAFHAKPIFASIDATLRFNDDLPADFRAGFAQPGKSYPAIVRFSNANASGQPDYKPDLRGVALRVKVSDKEQHDLLATNFPVSHARDARQFVAFAKATAGGAIGKLIGLVGLAFRFSPAEVIRMLRNVSKGRNRKVRSVALETFWSRGAIRWGETLAVRYLLRPVPSAAPAPEASTTDASYLSNEFATRLAAGDVRFELCVQPYIDERSTPIEDTAVEWTETVSPPVKVAELTITQPSVGTAEAFTNTRVIDELAFNPWNTTDEFRPLGNLNRARKVVYDASAAHRLAYRWRTEAPLRNRVLGAIARRSFVAINRFVEWHKLPLRLSLLNLDAFRYVLRQKNLIDTEAVEAPPEARPEPQPPIAEQVRQTRSYDGTYNDLSVPKMGAVGATFGRNLKPAYAPDLFDTPNPVVVAEKLLHRETFIPARSLNILAAAWIQFQVHDWVNHARNPLGTNDITVPLPPGMKWTNTVGGKPEQVMRIAGNQQLDRGPGWPPTYFGNAASHWWDGSEVYGPNSTKAMMLREGAKIRLVDNHLPVDIKGFEVTGFNESWWLGLGAMHTLFAREHNLLCDELRSRYKNWDDERIYQTARLIVSALIAKIHTVEWTPAILATRAIEIGLSSNWNGPPANDWVTKFGLWLLDEHASTGIPKTMPDHHTAPYSLTEDFTTVYRMHPLLPDDYCFYHHRSGEKIAEKGFLDIQGANADEIMRSFGLRNTLYSFGVAHPGAIALHNFPRSLLKLERDNEIIDLSVVDIVRTRRRGVPRYNDFRAGLHRPRIRSFEEVTASPEDARLLKQIYGDVDKIDTVVGLLSEPAPAGFGFSDTAFRIFILMASRRLQSDRFLTVDYRPEIYSPFGIDWIANNGMTSLILRHCPDLASVLPRTQSAFAPWRPIVPASTDPAMAGAKP
ncbi:peroxidase family protein [Mesorhizobium sp. WSM4904]|uniref:peroxidase family protein n=1 Tax=Mesorhizobium sp. WSM4904 TaxID=3038545 RepID=UPI002418956C|nr:peroxidase family protein [Mesorhizobium sp. WSM4904]WFP65884.1 peroxidase family protein [Mesorhizobium sp. WSM4904]